MKKYDLEERTFNFAFNIRAFVKRLPRSLANNEDIRQLVRSSGSVGANYLEANESISRKDFIFRIKICRKEATESHYFIKLLDTMQQSGLDEEKKALAKEALELTKIFGAIITKSN